MEAQARLLTAMVALVVLPIIVTGAAAVGMLRMSERLEAVSEEFGEVRALEPIDADFGVGLLALGQSSPHFDQLARDSFASARATLTAYLATQVDSVADEEHQANESSHASDLLARLETLLADFESPGADPPIDRTAIAEALRADLRALYADAEAGVHAAQRSAQATQRITVGTVLTASLLSAALCVAVSVWTVSGVSRRLRELHRTLSMKTEGVVPGDERDVGGVMQQIEAINERMLQRMEERGRELLRRERLAGVGLLAADVAHEINNPMNAMLGLSELALRSLEDGAMTDSERHETAESLRIIRREALRCKSIVGRLMAMVRSSHTPVWFDAGRLLQEAAQIAAAARPDRANCFHVRQNMPPLPVLAPQEDVKQIVLTLLINAADAVEPQGRIELDVVRTDEEVRLRVRDDGRGFTPEQREDMFTPFRTSKSAEGGAGLGLAIAWSLAADIGAEIRAYSEGQGQGSLFVLAIPVREESA